MPRYIDADLLMPNAEHKGRYDVVSAYDIANTPTADVRENVRGNWIEKEVIDDRKDAKIPQWQQARCSVCDKWHTTPYMYYFTNYNFCPNCGADMRGEEDD